MRSVLRYTLRLHCELILGFLVPYMVRESLEFSFVMFSCSGRLWHPKL